MKDVLGAWVARARDSEAGERQFCLGRKAVVVISLVKSMAACVCGLKVGGGGQSTRQAGVTIMTGRDVFTRGDSVFKGGLWDIRHMNSFYYVAWSSSFGSQSIYQ